MIGAIFAVALAASPTPGVETFREAMTARLLNGEGPLSVAELRAELSPLTPAERFSAIAFVRRAGLYAGAGLPLKELLRPEPLLLTSGR